MEILLPLLGALFFVYLLARGLGEVTRRLGLPTLVGEIVAGVVIANLAVGSFRLEDWIGLDSATGSGAMNVATLNGLADLGVAFLAFAVGLEILPSAVRRFVRPASITAVWGTAVPLVLGFALLVVVEGPSAWSAGLFAGVALVVTSLTVTLRALRERDLLGTDEAHVILGAALIEDVVGAGMLAVVLAVAAETHHGPVDLVYQVGFVFAGAGAFVGFFLYLLPRLVRRYTRAETTAPRTATRNSAFVLAILLCLGASALASSFQLASIVGALLAGMALSEFRGRFDLRPGFEALNTFFVPFFFVGIGFLVSVNELLAAWPLAAALTVLAVAGKLASVPADAPRLGTRGALRVGAGLVPRGEVALVVALVAVGAGLISGDLYAAIVVMAVTTSVIGPIALHRLFREGAPRPSDEPVTPEVTGL